ncbi:histamine H2 receptor-like [Clytia hemisphaerica]|uniref:histamine H2 receptor-like n=1 Tax=Clytia hemisphaerica TaxID=252671 RepID=UPI0034D62B3C
MTCYDYNGIIHPTFGLVARIVFAISGTTAALGNTFCLIVLWQPSQRSKSNRILTSLAISDCIVGYVCFPLAIWALHDFDIASGRACLAQNANGFMALWMTYTSTCSIVFIAYDRYVFITKFANYNTILTNRKVAIIMVFYWMIMFLFALAGNINIIFYAAIGPTFVIISIVILCTSYYFIWKVVRASGRRISAHEPNKIISRQEQKRQNKLAKKVLVLIIFYIVCFFPTFLLSLLVILTRKGYVTMETSAHVYFVTLFITLFNSCLNPFLYVWNDPEFKSACKRLLRKNKGSARVHFRNNPSFCDL